MPLIKPPFGFSVGSSGSDGSFFGTLQRLELTTNLKLCLDAGALASYSGGQEWKDLAGGGPDFYLGEDGSSESIDPTNPGTPGGLSSSEYFTTDGTQYFRAASRPSWVDELAKTGAVFTILAWHRPVAQGSDDALFSTFNGAGYNGICLYTNGSTVTNNQVFSCLNASAHRITNSTSGCEIAHALSQWHLVGIVLNEGGGASGSFFQVDGQYNNAYTAGTDLWDGAYSSSDPSTNTSPPALWRNSQIANSHMVSGSRTAGLMVWQGTALTRADIQDIWEATRSRFGLYNGTWDADSTQDFSAFGVDGYIGMQFTASKTGDITSATWYKSSGASGSDTVTCYIYSDDGGSPGHPLAVITNGTSTNTFSTGVAAGDQEFTFSGAAVTKGNKYWLVLSSGGGSVTPTYRGVREAPGYPSGRNTTLLSIASTGQAPKTSGKSWKVKIKYNGEA